MSPSQSKKLISVVGALLLLLISAASQKYLPGAVGISQQQSDSLIRVIRVIDGDTIQAKINGKVETIRLIGINTPETVDPRRTVECFGREASAKTKKLTLGKMVKIETDPSQDTRDKYGRLLAYIFLEDGTNINKKLIEDGYAYEYTYERPYRYQLEFRQAQKDAEAAERGLWAPGMCVNKSKLKS